MSLRDAYIIGNSNHAAWSKGFDSNSFLKVLPHPDTKIAYQSAWQEWQKGQAGYKNGQYTYTDPNGLYYSSWGPNSDVVELELKLSSFNELNIPGLGLLTANNTGDDSSYNDDFQFYNGETGLSHGPLIVVDPGDTIKVKLINDLPEDKTYSFYNDTNLHVHGLHVSAQGDSDNVLITIDRGETWNTEIKVPDDHFVGPDWYHPHLHGATNIQVSKGLAGPLLIQPSTEESDDLYKFDPVEEPIYWMNLQTWSLQQELREATSTDPVNQDPQGNAYTIATPPEVNNAADGTANYNVSDANYLGYNYMPFGYKPEAPNPSIMGGYGNGLNGTPIENVIHTVNGQYNPTIDAKVGEWNLFGFLNFSVNAHHVIQLVREYEGQLTLEDFELVAVDGDVAGAATEGLLSTTETPVIAPGARMTLQHAFTKPGKYYFLSNGTNEILGEDLAPKITNTKTNEQSADNVAGKSYYGFNDGHLVWGPQVLATVDVTGEAISQKPESPEPWDYIKKEKVEITAWMDETSAELAKGNLKTREFVWSAFLNDENGNAAYDRFGQNGVGSAPSDNDPQSFEGAYRINGRYFGHSPQEQTVLAMPMLGTTEEWTIINESYGENNGQWGEAHPFHIHQNDFVVTEINGLTTDQISAYPTNQLADTVLLGGAYLDGTETSDNPYGQAASLNDPRSKPFTAKIRMRFEDFPGAYVNHCHILFHEDAGMMQAVKVILNTDSTFLAADHAKNSVNLTLGSDRTKQYKLTPYASQKDNKNINVAIGDVNYNKFFGNPAIKNNANYKAGTNGFSDNITDIVTIQNSTSGDYTIRIFDGDAIKQAVTGKYKFAGFAPIAEENMKKVYINEEANLSQLTVESDVYWEKNSDNSDDHQGTGGAGTWGITTFEGTTYIEDVFDDDGNYVGWNASTDPSQITGANGETIPSSYTVGDFIFASKNGKDSLITSESHGVDDVNPDREGEESYTVTGGTGRFKGAKGEIFGSESFYGGADIMFSTNPELLIEATPQTSIDGTDKNYILKDITPFKDIKYTKPSETSLAVGDIDGDGHADIVAGIGAKNMKPVIEIYSGANYSLIGRINPFSKKGETTINLAAGDINSDNFVDIIVGQGEGGVGAVEAFSGRRIFDVIQNSNGIEIGGEDVKDLNPLNGQQLAEATSLFSGDFRPFKEDNYKGEVDVSSGYILPRPENNQTQEEVDRQVIQSSFANLIALKVDSKSTKKSPSIKTFYYTGGSSHATHGNGEMSSMAMSEDIPTLESSLNIQERLTSINGSFIDLSPNLKKRGQGTLIGQLMDGREYAYTINSNEIQEGEMQIFKHNSNSLNPGKTINARKRRQQKKLTGTSGNDHINGKRFKEKLYGMEGEDHLVGRHGNDFLSGGKDNDRLNGGPGRNTLIGGEGKDTFVVGNGFDTIRDFNSSDDVIQIKGGDFQLIANGNNTRIEMSDSNNWVVVLGIEASQLNLIS